MKRSRRLAAATIVIVALIVVATIPTGAWSKIHDKDFRRLAPRHHDAMMHLWRKFGPH